MSCPLPCFSDRVEIFQDCTYGGFFLIMLLLNALTSFLANKVIHVALRSCRILYLCISTLTKNAGNSCFPDHRLNVT